MNFDYSTSASIDVTAASAGRSVDPSIGRRNERFTVPQQGSHCGQQLPEAVSILSDSPSATSSSLLLLAGPDKFNC